MHQHPTYFKLHNSMHSAGQEGSRQGSSREPQAAWPVYQPEQPCSLWPGAASGHSESRAFTVGSQDSSKEQRDLCPQLFSSKKPEHGQDGRAEPELAIPRG